MGTLRAFYVRLRHLDADPAAIREMAGDGHSVLTEPGRQFAQVEWDNFRPPRPLLGRLSRGLNTEVIWLVFQSAVDAFAYEQWHAGRRGRTLVFGCFGEERTWECVEGRPEDWEPTELRHARVGEFAVVDARETARTVAEHYGFAGWS